MRDFLILFVHVIVTLARLTRPGGLRSVVAESVLVRHQLLILNRGRKRSPNLRTADRIIAGLCTLFIRPARVLRSAVVLKPFTLLHLHGADCGWVSKYRGRAELRWSRPGCGKKLKHPFGDRSWIGRAGVPRFSEKRFNS